MYVFHRICLYFAGPGIEVLKFYSTRVERLRKKNLSLEMNRKYPKDHSTVDKVGCRRRNRVSCRKQGFREGEELESK